MPASCTSRQPSNPRRHPTSWASSQWSHIVSSMPFHGALTHAPLSAHLSIECRCTSPQIETPICTRRTATHQFLWQQFPLTTTTYVRPSGRITNGMRSGRTTPQGSAFSSPTPVPTPQDWPSLSKNTPRAELSFFRTSQLSSSLAFRLPKVHAYSRVKKITKLFYVALKPLTDSLFMLCSITTNLV